MEKSLLIKFTPLFFKTFHENGDLKEDKYCYIFFSWNSSSSLNFIIKYRMQKSCEKEENWIICTILSMLVSLE